jgi:LemA protein
MWILIVVLIVLAGGIVMYNGLVRLREQVEASWADIDVQLKRRHDLIPNLVETVKGYATHEQSTLERVIQARNAAVAAHGPAKQAEAENVLTGALRTLFALSEAYPQLRADRGFGQLQETLASLEEHIQQARRYYNAVVRDYNTRTQQIPTSLIAGSFGFHREDFFEIDDAEKAVPGVRFGNDPGPTQTPPPPSN